MSNHRYTAVLYAFGEDSYGNAVSHYQLFDRKHLIAESGRNRKETGYSIDRSESVLAYLTDLKQRRYTPIVLEGSIEQGWIRVGFKQVRIKYARTGANPVRK